MERREGGGLLLLLLLLFIMGCNIREPLLTTNKTEKRRLREGPSLSRLASPRLSVRVLGEGRREEEKEKEGCLLKMRTKCVCVWMGGWVAGRRDGDGGSLSTANNNNNNNNNRPPLSFSLSSCAISPH